MGFLTLVLMCMKSGKTTPIAILKFQVITKEILNLNLRFFCVLLLNTLQKGIRKKMSYLNFPLLGNTSFGCKSSCAEACVYF